MRELNSLIDFVGLLVVRKEGKAARFDRLSIYKIEEIYMYIRTYAISHVTVHFKIRILSKIFHE